MEYTRSFRARTAGPVVPEIARRLAPLVRSRQTGAQDAHRRENRGRLIWPSDEVLDTSEAWKAAFIEKGWM
jgi:hypothetical protein